MSGGNPDCETFSNSTFAAACHPLICTIGDDFISLLRLLCHGSRLAADTERKRLQVFLPTHLSEQRFPEPRHLQSLLCRLRALAHVTITQGHADADSCPAAYFPGQPRPTSIDPLAKSSASSPSWQHGTGLFASCYWRTVLCALRPHHLRSLELDGLVVKLRTHGSGGTSSLDSKQLVVDGGFAAKHQQRRRRRRAADTRQISKAASMELVAELLARAPLLQELALLRVTVLPAVE
ncbi:hypothetical protein Vretifemale_2921, partial [Volvox reticuliferus]